MTLKDKIIQCDVTKGIPLPDKSVHLLMTIFAFLPQTFSFVKSTLLEPPPLLFAATHTGIFRFLIAPQGKDTIGLHTFFNQMLTSCLNYGRSYLISCSINRHYLCRFEAIHALVNSWLSSKAAAKLLLDKLKYRTAIHSNLNPLGISRTVNIRAIPHAPGRFLDANIAFAVNNSGDIRDSFFFGHKSLIPHVLW